MILFAELPQSWGYHWAYDTLCSKYHNRNFTTHAGVPLVPQAVLFNLPLDAYISYGLTLNGAVNNAVTTVTVTGM